MLQPQHKPDPVMVLGVLAVLVLVIVTACVRVGGEDGGDCDDFGMSAVAAPAVTRKPADRPAAPAAPKFSKAPAVSRAPVSKGPQPVRSAPATARHGGSHTGGHGGGHVDLDLCDD